MGRTTGRRGTTARSTRWFVASVVVGWSLLAPPVASAAGPDGLVGCSRRCAAPSSPAIAPSAPSGGCSRPNDDLRVRCLFDATGAPQAWVVPPDVSFVEVDAWGAGGSSPSVEQLGTGATAGRGAGVSVTVDVYGGETLIVDVGARGFPTRGNGPDHDGAGRQVRAGAGGDTVVSALVGAWILARGGGGATASSEGRGWLGVSGRPGSSSVRDDREHFGVRVDSLGKVGDGRVRLVYERFDNDGQPSVVVHRVPAHVVAGSGGSVHFTAVFSEPVTGFTGDDVRLDGTTPGRLTSTVRAAAPFDGAHYDITVVGMTSAGWVLGSVPAGVVTDDDFSTNTASTP